MPRLSVIIVNYNVRHFLEQAVTAVLRAAERVETEIIVVDNASSDDSCSMMRRRFPQVQLIENKNNTGFSAANNQGMALARGEYFLLLNPDTVIAEDTLEQTIAFMDAHPRAGGLGVKMLDGRGNFLPESKRAFPSPGVAFWKAFGFSALFPRSRIFGRYHLGYLDPDQTHEVEVLAGAFMLLRRSVIEQIGGLDETFFMYGEDIDLSYRIVQAGYANYYFPHSPIIHYKGESTKKGSLNYVRMFYSAMKIFARKHFSGSSARLYIALIDFAISLRAVMAVLRRIFGSLAAPLLDATLIFAGMLALKNFWEQNIKWLEGVHYPDTYLYVNVPLYIAIWLSAIWLSGGYDRDARSSRIVRGLFFGTLVIAAIYGFLEEGLRFSRGMILSGAIWAAAVSIGWRLLAHFFRSGNFRLGESGPKRVLIAGRKEEAHRVLSLLERFEVHVDLAGFVRLADEPFEDERLLGDMDQLADIAEVFSIDEVIFCGRDLKASVIIAYMTRLGPELEYKIVAADSLSIVGSNSKDTAGDLYSIDIVWAIDEPRQRRAKRIFDIGVAAAVLLSWPALAFLLRKPFGIMSNIFYVLKGSRSWVGYCAVDAEPKKTAQIRPLEKSRAEPAMASASVGGSESSHLSFSREERPGEERPGEERPGEERPGEERPGEKRRSPEPPSEPIAGLASLQLPALKPAVLCPGDVREQASLEPKTKARLNRLYARDYSTSKDWDILRKAWRKLGNTATLLLPLLGLMMAVTITPAQAQSRDGVSSRNGYWMPNRDTVRIFMVFAEVIGDPDDREGGEPESLWPRGRMPKNADEYLDFAAQPGREFNSRMTRFFQQASFGEYILLGDYYPKLARIPWSELKGNGDENIRLWLENEPGEDLRTAGGLSLNRDFDRWTIPAGFGRHKLKEPDGYGDFLLILWRVNSKVTKSDNSGSVNVGAWRKPVKGLQGFMDISRFVTRHSAGGGILQHEYSHSLYGGNNFHTGGRGAGNSSFMHPMGGFSNLSSFGSNSGTWNAWDRHRMGWKNPSKQFYISATCVSSGREVDLDLQYRQTLDCPGMEFYLDDFIDSGDALRIELPYVQQHSPDARRQYLWLENHQIRPGNQDHSPRMSRGIYAFVQVGKDDTSSFDGPGLYTAPLHPLGHYDLLLDPVQESVGIRQQRANPFTGLHLSMIPAWNTIEPNVQVNSRGDTTGVFPLSIFREETIYPKSVSMGIGQMGPEQFVYETHPALGTVHDAFRPGSIIALGHNPAPMPLYTWESKGTSRSPPYDAPRPNDNRIISLNGIRIEILEQLNDGRMRIGLGWNAEELQGSQRWCGNLISSEDVRLGSGSTLMLDLGLSPQKPVAPMRHRGEWVFSDTTVMRFVEGASLYAGPGSRITLRAGSRMYIGPGSTLELAPSARLILEEGSTLDLAPGSIFVLGEKSRLDLKGSTLSDRGSELKRSEGVKISARSSQMPDWCKP